MFISLMLMFMGGLFGICMSRKHLLLTLFYLEYLILSLYFVLYFFLLWLGCEIYFVLIFLVFSVCEGALGLGVLVSMIRGHGNDLLGSLSILSW
uniref:NADH-ubiquinone oxidoreductase chain 4L n=1 Tax=Melamphaus rubrocinctus TaxID=238647 RepID=A0A4Y1JVT7_9HEMI|nr:NADH dehydrogenase subunit 4L [Melamphaus rubrocinctus]APO08867.1 NADH dehydrogenase subunit 4L [Melamphaus rubrocinctus]